MAYRDELARAIASVAHPIVGARDDFDPILARVGNARIVLLGEATHGTHDFYRMRAQITKRLIMEKHFTAVAVEADWPDAYRVNRYVKGIGNDADAGEALADFARFPQWMWRNADVLDFVGWLRSYNDQRTDPRDRVGFYGLDLYSLHASMQAVLGYLDRVDPEAAGRARYRYACFEHFGDDPRTYGYATSFGMARDCEREVLAQLLELQRRQQEILKRDGLLAEDEHFHAEQNARVAMNAEEYYRSMFRGRVTSWNSRDMHMADTLDALLEHLDRRGGGSRIVVWAHNSHVGDARATEMGAAGELNVGQLVRERHKDARLVGFTTYTGTVTAASEWGAAAERKTVRPAVPGSYEAVFHASDRGAFVLPLAHLDGAGGLRQPRLERAIGVVYKPETERVSHYLDAQLPEQFDAIIHVDHTRALEPLERTARWEEGELPDTYPSGM